MFQARRRRRCRWTAALIDRGRPIMKRRNFLVGVGGTAIGASALVGSGAFTSVEAQRDIEISVVGDAEAYLQLTPSDGVHGDNYADFDDEDGTLYIDVAESGAGDDIGQGLNRNANTIMRDVFEICNHGKQEVYAWVEGVPEGMGIFTDNNPDGDDTTLEVGDQPETPPLGHPEPDKLLLEVGDCHKEIGFWFTKDFVNANQDGDEFTLQIWAATEDEIEKSGLGAYQGN